MTRLVSWNVNKRTVWDGLAATGAEVALLQEVPEPTEACPFEVLPGGITTWTTAGFEHRPWRTAIARLTDGVAIEPVISGEISGVDPGALPISRSGTITAAKVLVGGRPIFTAVSVYAPWERYLGREKPLWADGSAHLVRIT